MALKLIFIVLSIFIIWQLFVYLRANPEALSKNNLSRSFFTLGVLALILIAFVTGLVVLVKYLG
jgi:hypothetical protein